jgi:hypothetical protein
MHMNGPANISRDERLQICHEIASRLHEVYGEYIRSIRQCLDIAASSLQRQSVCSWLPLRRSGSSESRRR